MISIKLNNTTIAEVECVESLEGLQQIVCGKLVSWDELWLFFTVIMLASLECLGKLIFMYLLFST